MLTESKVARLVPGEKPRKVSDGEGLYLLITPAGGKLWRLNYRWRGRQKTLAIGKWPTISLAMAREVALEARRKLADGIDPAERHKAEIQGQFTPLALEWFHGCEWSGRRRRAMWNYLQRYVAPVFGACNVAEISVRDVDEFLQKTASEQSPWIARACAQIISAVFLLGIRRGFCGINPVPMLRGTIPPGHSQHHPTLLEPSQIGELLRFIDTTKCQPHVRLYMQVLPLVFVRPQELRLMRWDEVNLADRLWIIPAARMKLRREHLVPLSRQVMTLLESARGWGDEYVFTNAITGKPISDPAARRFLRQFDGGRITPHGFRSMARTLLHERLHFSPDAIEAQLAHRVPDRLGTAYNRAQHLEERIRMMQAWADFLDSLK